MTGQFSSYPVTTSGPVAFINARLTDLAEANALYGKDQRLGAPDKIARNDREISWLKDLRSIIVTGTHAQAYYCETCHGDGKYDRRICGLAPEADDTCIDCKGTGIAPQPVTVAQCSQVPDNECPKCVGTGSEESFNAYHIDGGFQSCRACNGTGVAQQPAREKIAERIANWDGNTLNDEGVGIHIAEHDKEKYRKRADQVIAMVKGGPSLSSTEGK